jgi:1,4-dihydroxy-2-naphthoate octaprenyltransferase
LSWVQVWYLAIRPKTLPASMAPIFVGVSLAFLDANFALWPALAALTASLLLQVGVNLANDYFDFKSGIDAQGRLGPVRVTQSGLLQPGQVKAAVLIVFGLVVILGLYLVYRGGLPILALGLASILSALAYSGGPYPLASHGLGDLFVFIFFGPGAVCGTYYVQALVLPFRVVLASFPAGLLVTAILVVNNLRDLESDRSSGKKTLAVSLGVKGSRIEFLSLILGSYLLLPAMIWLGGLKPWVLLPLFSVKQAWETTAGVFRVSGPGLNTVLAQTAKLALIFCLWLSLGIALSG